MSECRTGCEGFCSVLAASTALVINSRLCAGCRCFQMCSIRACLIVHMGVRNGDIDGCGDNSNLFGISQFIGSQSLIKGYTVRFCHSVAVNGALKCHQCNFARGCVVFRTVSVQKQRFFRPVKSIPAECGFNSVGGLSAACNIGKSAWNFQSTFQSKNDTYLLHVNGERDCFTGIC